VAVLELFTSQGCSSCPSADRLLTTLAEDPSLRDKVIPLAFHVDYWNHIGWSDPFSSSSWTERQAAYNRALGHDGLYTPELVVHGRAHVVGSDAEGASREIASALAAEPAVRVHIAPVRVEGKRAQANVTVEVLSSLETSGAKAYAALYESGLVTPVSRGENLGRTLRNDFVVRRVVDVADVASPGGAKRDASVTFELSESWKTENLGIAVFVQDPKRMQIYGAAARAVR
jgi:hypothetical protein